MPLIRTEDVAAVVVTFQCDEPTCGRRVRLLRHYDGSRAALAARLPRGWTPAGDGCICGTCHYTKTGDVGLPRVPKLPAPPSGDGN